MNPKKPKIKLSKRVNCPYCNKEFKFRKIIRDELDLCFECRNHPTTDIVVKLWFNYNGDLLSVNMTNYPLYNDDLEVVSKSKSYYIIVSYNENYMSINSFYYKDLKIKIPIDKSLTPENFEERLKLYLTFQ